MPQLKNPVKDKKEQRHMGNPGAGLKPPEFMRRYSWLLTAGLAFLAVLPRMAYLNVPFERDEGAYAYVADTIARGDLPYLNAFDHKPPMVYYIYNAAFRLFGHTVMAPRLMAALFVFFGCLFACHIVTAASGSLAAGILTMFLLGLATSAPVYSGFSANTEVFLFPLLLGGYCLLLTKDAPSRLHFLTGLLFGAAFAIKPVAAPVALVGGLSLLLWRTGNYRKAFRDFGYYAAGCALPMAAFSGYFLAKKAFGPFWEGFYIYNVGYINQLSLKETARLFLSAMRDNLAGDPVTWAAGLAGLVLFCAAKGFPGKRVHLAFLAAAFLATAMGRYFYSHYFLLFVPFLSVCAGLGAGRFALRFSGRVVAAVFLLVVMAAAATQAKYFRMPRQELLARIYGGNPFYQSVALADYLKANTGKAETVYIIGSEPQILSYAGLKSASRVFYFYPLSVPSALRSAFRAETLAALERSAPEYVLFVNAPTSHLLQAYFDKDFIARLFGLFSQYELVAVSPFGSDRVLETPAAILNRELLGAGGSITVFRRPGLGAPATGVRFSQLYHVS